MVYRRSAILIRDTLQAASPFADAAINEEATSISKHLVAYWHTFV